jgi:CheY-like chemotaxis protein
LAAFADREPDLVLLDLRLPDMSGFEVCRNLRATSIVPIIIVTAQADTYDLVAGLEAGADDYVTKPVVPRNWRPGSEPPCVVFISTTCRRSSRPAASAMSNCVASRGLP